MVPVKLLTSVVKLTRVSSSGEASEKQASVAWCPTTALAHRLGAAMLKTGAASTLRPVTRR